MFSEREAKLVGTSDFVVTRGYVQIRVVGFPWETASALAARSIDEFVEVKCWFSHARERRGGSIGGLISVVVARKTGELRHRARYGGSLSGRQKVCA